MLATVRYRWSLLRAGAFKLDGGSMFGLVPRVVWSKAVPTDERGRISVQHNCLLLERDGDPPTAPAPPVGSGTPQSPPLPAPKLVLLEVGTGNKLDDKSRDIFALENRWIGDALHEANCRPDDIEAVVVSHLHFDHAGGLTRRCTPSESPDWTPDGATAEGGGVKLTFPSARVHAQRREWLDAIANRSVMTRTYFPDHLHPIRERLVLAESLPPFVAGYVPGREQDPPYPLESRLTEIIPGIHVLLVPGHTWGQQATLFTDTKGRTVVFTPDVMPTINHVGAAYSLGYDVEPYTSMVSRRWFLQAAAERGWLLVLDHEPGNPLCRVRPNGKGWFELTPAE
ncbi:MAG: MBL fold metallo-hydrolase [Phycisphaerales bacterium]